MTVSDSTDKWKNFIESLSEDELKKLKEIVDNHFSKIRDKNMSYNEEK